MLRHLCKQGIILCQAKAAFWAHEGSLLYKLFVRTVIALTKGLDWASMLLTVVEGAALLALLMGIVAAVLDYLRGSTLFLIIKLAWQGGRLCAHRRQPDVSAL